MVDGCRWRGGGLGYNVAAAYMKRCDDEAERDPGTRDYYRDRHSLDLKRGYKAPFLLVTSSNRGVSISLGCSRRSRDPPVVY